MTGKIATDYRANYEKIASDHLAHWRATGVNPWQSAIHVEAVGKATADLIHKYSLMGARILDAGCAMGDLLARVQDRSLYGIDFNAEYLAVAAERGIETTIGELEAMPYPDETFDLVVTTDVLEHVLDEKVVIREMLRVLAPGGILIVRAPDAEDLSGYLDPEYPYRFVHLRRFDEPSLRLLFDRIFAVQVVETSRVYGTAWEIHIVVRKP